MIGFEPTADQKMMMESVAQFAKATLRPRVRETERLRALPDDVRRAAKELGLARWRCPRRSAAPGSGW